MKSGSDGDIGVMSFDDSAYLGKEKRERDPGGEKKKGVESCVFASLISFFYFLNNAMIIFLAPSISTIAEKVPQTTTESLTKRNNVVERTTTTRR